MTGERTSEYTAGVSGPKIPPSQWCINIGDSLSLLATLFNALIDPTACAHALAPPQNAFNGCALDLRLALSQRFARDELCRKFVCDNSMRFSPADALLRDNEQREAAVEGGLGSGEETTREVPFL